MSFRGMRKQTTKGETAREVVRLDDPLGGEQASSTSAKTTTSTPVQEPQGEYEEAVQSVEVQQQPTKQEQEEENPASLEDLLAQVMESVFSSAQGLDEDVPLDGKVTLYFEPAHMEKLLEVRKRFKGNREQLPNMQDIMRYLVEKIEPSFFDGFPKNMYDKRMQKAKAALEKRLGKMTQETRRQLKGLFPD